ncbi:MAG: hypothetical protein E6R03_04730 [Hyphomicrobiaceae bacterium]|nr:MAG: hypothetical protein E6R03_04730 [Hyphomicrobiaceae bacterium]
MAAIASSDVTYVVERKAFGDLGYESKVTVSFGDGALTYPAGGVPLTAAGLGCPNGAVEFIEVVDPASASGFIGKIDFANLKLRLYEVADTESGSAYDAALAERDTGDAPAAISFVLRVVGY